MQSQLVADELEKRHSGLQVSLEIIKTTGDRIADRPLYEEGGKGLFVRELEQALLDGRIDLAVHSFKDVPVTMPLVAQENLVIAAVPLRADPRDVLVCDQVKTLDQLPPGSRIGTGSLRRRCQILAKYPNLAVLPIRGNIDTRLNKLAAGEYDAIVLALAGVRRGGLYDASRMAVLELDQMLPAAGQGALALQCRREDDRTRQLVAPLHDPSSAQAVEAERALVAMLEGDCHSPIAALATIACEELALRAAVGGRDGAPPVLSAEASGPAAQASVLVQTVFEELTRQGVQALLAGVR
jgi:hydroxymethylbilane synthase